MLTERFTCRGKQLASDEPDDEADSHQKHRTDVHVKENGTI